MISLILIFPQEVNMNIILVSLMLTSMVSTKSNCNVLCIFLDAIVIVSVLLTVVTAATVVCLVVVT